MKKEKTKIPQKLFDILTKEGYTHLKYIDAQGICGLHRFVFTVGLVVGLHENGYKGRYCYENSFDAIQDISSWDGIGHPQGDWIKYKGEGLDLSNPNLKHIQ